MSFYSFIRPVLFSLNEEKAHNVAISALKKGFIPKTKTISGSLLENKVFDIYFPNPVGLAAGFDKNAEVISPLLNQGFGFIEVGTVTLKPQEGNPKPRLFRLEEDKAVINRLGFNNAGIKPFVKNLEEWKKTKEEKNLKAVVGVNIGKNKDSEGTGDYEKLLRKVYGLCDYITINVSSPNTPKLRDLQNKKELDDLLSSLIKARNSLIKKGKDYIPLLLKISPDMDKKTLENMARLVLSLHIDGIIVSNTTIGNRGSLKHEHHSVELGGLSGKPLFSPSTNLLRDVYRLTKGKIPLIGTGGIFSGEDAYDKIRSGASLVQIYTSLVYGGLGLVNKITKELASLLERDGFNNISEAIGVDVKK